MLRLPVSLVACLDGVTDQRPTSDRVTDEARPVPVPVPVPAHTEPCFMERNRKDVATLETLRTRATHALCLCCTRVVLAHEAWAMPLMLARLRFALLRCACRPLDALFTAFCALCKLTNYKK